MNNPSLKKIETFSVSEVVYEQDETKLELNNTQFDKVIIHHSGNKDYTIKDLIDYHTGKLGMGAIGYHFVIDSNGVLYSTRNIKYKGAHAYPNTGKIGVGFLRSFDKNEPNPNEITTLKILMKILSEKLGTTVLGHNQDQITELIKKNPDLLEKHKDILSKLWTPISIKVFEAAKEKLFYLKDSEEYRREVQKLKTCPGINAYKEMMQDV